MTPLALKRHSGFTLIELLVVMVIVAITLTIALPSFNDALVRNRLAGQSNDLIAGISLARTAAIELNTGGGFCAANSDFTGCGGSWSNGWLAWADVNRNGSVQADEIRGTGRVSAKDQLVGFSALRFDGRGRRIEPAVASGTSSLEMRPVGCETGKPFNRSINVTVSGTTSVIKGNC